MTELKKTKDMVALVLQEMPCTRNDDFLLIAEVYRRFFGVTDRNTFFEVMKLHRGLPSFESIRRSRQKLQAENPLVYGASGDIRKLRIDMEEEYRKEFAK